MLRIALLALAAIFIVLVVAAVVRTFVWLLVIAFVVVAAGLLLGVGVRTVRGSARQARRH